MARDDSSPTDEGEVEEVEEPQTEPSSQPSDEWLEQALGRLADSGKLFGSPAQEPPPQRPRAAPAPAPAPASSGLNLREEIQKVLNDRDQERQQKERDEGIASQLAELRKQVQGKKKHWFFDPFSPWGG